MAPTVLPYFPLCDEKQITNMDPDFKTLRAIHNHSYFSNIPQRHSVEYRKMLLPWCPGLNCFHVNCFIFSTWGSILSSFQIK